MAFATLAEGDSYPGDLARALDEVRDKISFCTSCHMLAESERCAICMDPARDCQRLCIVSTIPDVLAFERSGAFRGRYHVTHGVLSPLKGIGPQELRIGNLRRRVQDEDIEEVILATPTGVEGEATALYLTRILADLDLEVTRIATGVPMGGELEYVDPTTLSRALEGRRTV
jgi:recombination protein RecR